ncbi:hypothetical protein [Nocardia niwae]
MVALPVQRFAGQPWYGRREVVGRVEDVGALVVPTISRVGR